MVRACSWPMNPAPTTAMVRVTGSTPIRRGGRNAVPLLRSNSCGTALLEEAHSGGDHDSDDDHHALEQVHVLGADAQGDEVGGNRTDHEGAGERADHRSTTTE